MKTFQPGVIIVYRSYTYPPNSFYLNHGLVRKSLLPLVSRVILIYHFSKVPLFHSCKILRGSDLLPLGKAVSPRHGSSASFYIHGLELKLFNPLGSRVPN